MYRVGEKVLPSESNPWNDGRFVIADDTAITAALPRPRVEGPLIWCNEELTTASPSLH